MKLITEDPINLRCPKCNKFYRMVDKIDTEDLPTGFRIKCYGCPEKDGTTNPQRGKVYKQYYLDRKTLKAMLDEQGKLSLKRVVLK